MRFETATNLTMGKAKLNPILAAFRDAHTLRHRLVARIKNKAPPTVTIQQREYLYCPECEVTLAQKYISLRYLAHDGLATICAELSLWSAERSGSCWNLVVTVMLVLHGIAGP